MSNSIDKCVENCPVVLARVQFSISVPFAYAHNLIERSLCFFRSEFGFLLLKVMGNVFGESVMVEKINRIFLDLGEVDQASFELDLLTLLERRLAGEMWRENFFSAFSSIEWNSKNCNFKTREIGAGEADFPVKDLSAKVHSQVNFAPSNTELDQRVSARLQLNAPASLSILARSCVEERTLEYFFKMLQPRTRSDLVRRLVEGTSIAWDSETCDKQTIYIAALLYFLLNLHEIVPRHDARTLVLAIRPTKHEHWLLALFDCDAIHSASPPLKERVKGIYRQPEVRNWLKTRFSAAACLRLEREFGIPKLETSQRGDDIRFSDELVDLTKDAFSVDNAGTVLIWPLLANMFGKLGLWIDGHFVQQRSAVEASAWLSRIASSDEVPYVYPTALSNVLCGVSQDADIRWLTADKSQHQLLQAWLTDLPAKIRPWHQLTIEDIRALFIRRPGILTGTEPGGTLELEVEPHASDVLLQNWPWPITTVLLPWMEKPLTVQWGDL
ncbi:contractile injection system tape measure protein [Paraburkholderia sp. D15]|uniref:contractile injection system tape measure protein n=1 Tax=Paraburkholderia sp. D15 TaxID=2880218 RepID=UPI002479BB64|nr:contractile injection system tape measure protein [Paraburkholderia sp. D15]WGS53950.1 contractile injection system tape measure protein [Paraburkholderia sp. D15]